ncbi:hypothetical protein C2E23DRAFT_856866 [Lenzites betulinus]|nr:hypothetical protein C2E23DRAFT_856866 [Lenzites betulinus]
MGEEIGTLIVVVLKARNLRDKHTFYKQDAYTQASLNKDTKKTKVDVKGGQHPVWDEELRFPVHRRIADETRKLEVSCWSKEPRSDECVGRGTVDITETLKTGEFDESDWVPLKMEDGAYRGELFLEMTYYAKTPPLQRRASKWKPTERLTRPTSTFTYPEVPPVPTASAVGAAHVPNVMPAVVESSAEEEELPLPAYPQDTRNPPHANGQHSAAGTHLSPTHRNDPLPPLPEEAAAIPAILRPGGGKRISPQTSPKAGNGHLPPEQSAHAHVPSPRRDTASSAQVPFESIPPYLHPGGSHTPIPEPQLPAPQSYPPASQNHPPPAPQSYPPPTQNYPPPAQIYSPAPPQSYPPLGQSYIAPPQIYPPQTYGPPPPVQHYPPAPQSYGPAAGQYGSPPRQYAPITAHAQSQGYVSPYGPPPVAPAYLPYGYPPPSRTVPDSAPAP